MNTLRSRRLLRQPPSWGWFIGVLVLTVREIARGHYLGLATAIPFLLVSLLAAPAAHLPLWMLFTLGAAVNLAIALIGDPHYIDAGIYLLLVVYGADEAWKSRKPKDEPELSA